MTAPAFRVLNKEELARLSFEERVQYTKKLIEHVRHVTADMDRSAKARQERLARARES